jgi:tetratricopeptide (TPR) repeat protein
MERFVLSTANEPQNGSGRDRLLAEATHGFLRCLPPSLLEAVWAAAIPHWFDEEILARILDIPKEGAEALCAHILDMPFIQQVGQWHAVHELVRRLLLDNLWRWRRKTFLVWSRRAAETFEGHSDNPNFLIESIYHWLVADPDRGIDLVKYWWAKWSESFQCSYLYALVQAGLEHKKAGRLGRRAQGWVLFYDGQLWILRHKYERALEAMKGALRFVSEDRQLEADCLKTVGDVARKLREYDLAWVWYVKAMSIYQEIGDRLGEANCKQALEDMSREY